MRHEFTRSSVLDRVTDDVRHGFMLPGVARHSLQPDEPAVLDYSHVLPPMTHAEARALQTELREMLVRHARDAQGSPVQGARRSLVRLGLAPERLQDDRAEG